MSDPRFFLNANGAELRVPGLRLIKTTEALRGLAPSPEGFFDSPLGFDETGAPSSGLWREPSKGALMLRPSSLRPDFTTNPAFRPFFVDLSQLRFDPSDLIEVALDSELSRPGLLATLRRDRNDPFVGVSPPIGYETLPIEGLTWMAETRGLLAPNEGWSVFFRVSGPPTDQPPAFLGVAFGLRWYLQLDGDGRATLFYNAGSPNQPVWVARGSLALTSGIRVGKTFQLTVVPWGIDGLTMVLSDGNPNTSSNRSDYASVTERGHLFEARRHGIPTPWSADLQQYRKTDPASLAVAVPSTRYALAFQLARVRYLPCGFAVAPERLESKLLAQTPHVTPFGFWNQRRNSGSAGASIFSDAQRSQVGVDRRNLANQTWDRARDVELVASAWLVPDASSTYSPELWAMEYAVEPETEVTVGTEQLVTGLSTVRGTWSSHARADAIEIERIAFDENVSTALGGRVRLELDGRSAFEGYLESRRSEWRGAVVENRTEPVLVERFTATDLWGLAETISAAHFPALISQTLGAVIREVFRRLGTPPQRMEVSPELDEIALEGLVEAPDRFRAGSEEIGVADDWKIVHENGTLADVLRALMDRFRAQGPSGGVRELRIHARGGTWRALLTREPAPEDPTDLTFTLDGAEIDPLATDAERFEQRIFRVFESFGLETEVPEFNTLRSFASIGSGAGGDAVAAFIATAPDVIADPESPDYQGVVRAATLGPPDTALAATPSELERLARAHYDRFGRVARRLVLDAEWQPTVEPDHIARLAFTDRNGSVVDLGRWNIETIDFRYELDRPHLSRARYELQRLLA